MSISPSISSTVSAGSVGAAAQVSAASSSFTSLLNQLAQKPLGVLPVQAFSGASARGLQQQVLADTARA